MIIKFVCVVQLNQMTDGSPASHLNILTKAKTELGKQDRSVAARF